MTPGLSPAGPWVPWSNLFNSHTRYLSHCGTLTANRYALHTLKTGSITSPFSVSASLSCISCDDKCDKLSPLLWPNCRTSCNNEITLIILSKYQEDTFKISKLKKKTFTMISTHYCDACCFEDNIFLKNDSCCLIRMHIWYIVMVIYEYRGKY